MSFLGDTGIRVNNPPGPSPTLDARYAPGQSGLLLPVGCVGGYFTANTTSVWASASRGIAHRFICDKTGTLSDISFWVITQSGNYDLAVYDCGDTTPAVRTRLYSKGSTAVPAGGAWASNNPNLQVKAGQHIDIGLVVDNTTAAILKWANLGGAAAQSQLPSSSYLRGAVSALPKVAWQQAAALPWASTVSEANAAQTQNTVLLVATIT